MGQKYCDLCQNMDTENAEHIIMHCPGLETIRSKMFSQIETLERSLNSPILANCVNVFSALFGNIPNNLQSEVCIKFLRIVAVHVYEMYQIVMRSREGIG